MTDKLPPNLLALFAPRPPLRYLPPADQPPQERRTAALDSTAAYIPALREKAIFAKACAAGEISESDPSFERPPTVSWLEHHDNTKFETAQRQKWLISEGWKELYKPLEQTKGSDGEAFRTLFLARLSFAADENDIKREFGRFGPIEKCRIVRESGEAKTAKAIKNKGKSKGYGFVVFEKERDMKAAYKETDGISIRGRRILVDVERGRTVTGWKPRRFGGGLGGRHYTKAASRPAGFGFGGPPPGPGGFRGGGFRGGFERGGFRGGGGFRGRGDGGFRGGRGGLGYAGPNGYPDGAPQGPRGGAGFGSPRRYDDRAPRGNANLEPLPPRSRYNDRDREDAGYGGGSGRGQKRPYDGGGGYDESRSRRRY